MESENVKNNNEELEVLISYIQLVYYTLKNSTTDINPETAANYTNIVEAILDNEEVLAAAISDLAARITALEAYHAATGAGE